MGKVMIIYPNQGIGPIKFGMSPEEVKALMGIEEVYEPWMGGNRNDSLLYPGLIIGFDKCDASGPLSDSKVVDFVAIETFPISFNGINQNDLTRETMKNMIAYGEKAASVNYFL